MNPSADRAGALNEAALRLVSADREGGAALRAVREILLPLSAEAAAPDWVRQAMTTAADLLDQGASGVLDYGSVVTRVGALIELAMQDASGNEGGNDAAAAEQFVLPPDAARELFPEFVAESLEYFEQIERALLQLEANPADREAINVVFRAFHTIKSTASFLGFEPIATLAHHAESLLSHLRAGDVAFDGMYADITLYCADMLRELFVQARGVIEGGSFDVPEAYHTLLVRLAQVERYIAAGAGKASAEEAERVRIRQPRDSTREGNDGSIRVRTERLDTLVNLIGELVVAHSMVTQDPVVEGEPHGSLARKVSHSGKIVRDLQALGMAMRMVPLRPVFQRMQRLTRDVARDSGKQVEFIPIGLDTEIDRNMVDLITDPLVHMVRNAIDHGIESPADRVAAGKPARGTLRLTASHEAGDVVVELRDDGRGLDHDRIRATAEERGLVAHDRELTPAEIYNFIFSPGLSTAATLTELSGRGVGMDVVRRNIDALRGRIDITSVPGQGTTFTLRLPLTLAITDGMLVRIGRERYVIPTAAIHMSFRPEPAALSMIAGAGELVMLHGTILPIVRTHKLFGIDDAERDPTKGLLVVIGHGDKRYALLVDELLGQQQFVVKPVGDALGSVRGVAGAAILGDGSVGLILDPGGVIAQL